jgi:hypothetical protein
MDRLFRYNESVLVNGGGCAACPHWKWGPPIVDRHRWHKVCKPHKSEAKLVRHQHSATSKPRKWGFPDSGDATQNWKNSVTKLQEYDGRLLRIVAPDAGRLYTGAFLWESAFIGLFYQNELWAAPCRIARSLSPLAVAHVRAGDGKFKQRIGHAASLLVGFGKQVSALDDDLAKLHNATSEKGDLTILFVTDVSSIRLWETVLSMDPWQTLIQNVTTRATATKGKVRLLNSIVHGASAYATTDTNDRSDLQGFPFEDNSMIANAIAQLTTALGNIAIWKVSPKQAALETVAQMLFDVMLASLAKIFSGSSESSLSLHIEANRRGLAARTNQGSTLPEVCSQYT